MGVPERPAPPLVTPGGHRCALSSRVCRPAGHGAAGHRCSVVPQSPVGSPAAAQARQLAIGAAWGRSRAKPSAPAKAKSGMLGWMGGYTNDPTLISDASAVDVDVSGHGRVLENSDVTWEEKVE